MAAASKRPTVALTILLPLGLPGCISHWDQCCRECPGAEKLCLHFRLQTLGGVREGRQD